MGLVCQATFHPNISAKEGEKTQENIQTQSALKNLPFSCIDPARISGVQHLFALHITAKGF